MHVAREAKGLNSDFHITMFRPRYTYVNPLSLSLSL